jgi:pimeloyl-ACP methyl ester carboxylesterase
MRHPSQSSRFPTPFLLCFLLILTLLAACTATGQPEATPSVDGPTVSLEDCTLAAPDSDSQMDAQCGTLTVFENPDTQTGRQIGLHIAVIPAVSRNPAPDPLFFLTGGPGQAATESFLTVQAAFRDINRERDIVLVDQRGTGQSHPLRCEFPAETDFDENTDIRPFLEDCLSQLDADPKLYTTAIAMQDLDQVREALGYSQINLYGVSYGTRAALTYLRMYPDRVRAAILDGVVAQQLVLGLDLASDAQHALELIFARCETDATCAKNFPDLPSQVQEILSQLDEAPIQTQVTDPITGERIDFEFSRETFATIIRFYSYSPETVALLPLLISTAEGDYSRLASQYLILTANLTASINNGMGYSVQCAEDVPFFTAEEALQASEGTYLGDMISGGLLEICETWPRGTIPADFKDPVRSDVPVLLLSGEYDPVTPPAYAGLAAETLPNSLHLIAPGQGHNVILRGCIPDIAENFIATGTVNGLETDCVGDIEPFPFFVNFSGPEP